MSTFYERNFEIFFIEKEAIMFVENIGRLMNRPCLNNSCSSIEDLKLCKDSKYLGGFRYSCRSCKENISAIKYIGEEMPKIKVCRLLHITYLYLMKLRNWQVISLISVSKTTYIYLKSRIIKSLEVFVDTSEKLGGDSLCVQIDETACCRRRLIYSPTSEAEYLRDTSWV